MLFRSSETQIRLSQREDKVETQTEHNERHQHADGIWKGLGKVSGTTPVTMYFDTLRYNGMIEGRMGDALALGGEEGRDKLR